MYDLIIKVIFCIVLSPFQLHTPPPAMASIGGLYTSIVVKYLDNIIKGFSTAVSIIMAALGSFLLFHKSFGHLFIGGSVLVMAAIYLYSMPKPVTPAQKLPQKGPQNV